MNNEHQKILRAVEKPYRYIGGEFGARTKDWDKAAVRLCLAFPDTYEMGMSNVGLSILYHIVNEQPDMLAERAFAPWTDMEHELASRDVPLFSLESKRPLKEFDVVGIGLPYELSYTNILTILELSEIPARSKDRDGSYPLIIAGGPCAFNPEPVADFFDAIVIGDGEKTLIRILDLLKEEKSSRDVIARSESDEAIYKDPFRLLRSARNDVLNRLAKIDGVYVPALGNEVKKAIVDDIETSPFPKRPVVPYAAVHDRVGIEVARGCTRGCRFCQAGFIYRPVRLRTPETATKLAIEQLKNNGHEDLSFLSLSLGDYPCLNELLKSVNDGWDGPPINPQFPSLRVESLTDETLSLLGKARHGSFTLAPEAATEKMRNIINKGNTDEDLYSSVEKIFKAGWHQIKLYFMIGLPGETKDEIDGIVAMANKCLTIGKKYHPRAEVTVSTSTFVPKSHTPFQWSSQISIAETIEKQNYLKGRLRRHGLYYRWHNAQMSFLEGVFSRGDRKLSYVVEEAHKLGARFDAWDDKFNFSIWKKAFALQEIDPHEYLRQREHNEKFPWYHLYTDLKKDFLWNEYERSVCCELTPDCRLEGCTECGVCSDGRRRGEGIGGRLGSERIHGCDAALAERKSAIAGRNPAIDAGPPILSPREPTVAAKYSYRLQLTKTGPAAFLGHLEFSNVIRRACRRAGLPLKYSEGYHPHSKISFGKALSVGIESECEHCDVELLQDVACEDILMKLANSFPEGIRIVSATKLEKGAPSIERSVAATSYMIEGEDISLPAVSVFNSSDNWPFARQRGERTVNIDLKDYIARLVAEGRGVVGLTLIEREPMVRVLEAVSGIFNLKEEDLSSLKIRKTICQMNL